MKEFYNEIKELTEMATKSNALKIREKIKDAAVKCSKHISHAVAKDDLYGMEEIESLKCEGFAVRESVLKFDHIIYFYISWG